MNIDQYLLQKLSGHQLLITNELRAICQLKLKGSFEKLAYGVPHFYLNQRVAFVWPTEVPKSGVDSGVLLGFWKGNRIVYNKEKFRGQSNRVVRFRVYHSIDDILNEIEDISKWCDEAKKIDATLSF